jgi:hypothetical protein
MKKRIAKYDSDQMEQIRLGLEDGLDVSWYADPRYDSEQMNRIRTGLKENLYVKWYANPDFNKMQMREIMIGLRNGLDVKWYAKPEFNQYQMEQIRYGLEEGLDPKYYADPAYKPYQIKQIILGLKSKVDVSIYSEIIEVEEEEDKEENNTSNPYYAGIALFGNSENKSNDKNELFTFDSDNKNIVNIYKGKGVIEDICPDFDININDIINKNPEDLTDDERSVLLDINLFSNRSRYLDGDDSFYLDIKRIIHERFGIEDSDDYIHQMIKISSLSEESEEDEEYESSEKDYEESNEDNSSSEDEDADDTSTTKESPIKKVLSFLSRGAYNEDQLHQINLGKEHGVDTYVYSDPRLNAKQMKQIRKGLEDGLDVSLYAKTWVDHKYMKKMRKKLKKVQKFFE